jgi:hypothetical protein
VAAAVLSLLLIGFSPFGKWVAWRACNPALRRERGAKHKSGDPGGESPCLHKPGFKNFFLKNEPGAEGWGYPVGALVRAMGQSP